MTPRSPANLTLNRHAFVILGPSTAAFGILNLARAFEHRHGAMPLYKLQLTWGNPPDPAGHRWRFGLFLVSRRRHLGWQALARDGNRRTLVLSVRGLLLWSLPFMIAAYFAGAAALLHWYQRNPYNQITYADLALPHRWNDLRALRGRALIAEAREDLAEGRLQAGFGRLRTGLERDPSDTEARVLLAHWCVIFRLRPLAHRTLFDGCSHGYQDATQLKNAFAILNEADSPRLVLDFISRTRSGLLALGDTRGDAHRVLDEQEMRTLIAMKRPQDALKLVQERRPSEAAWLHEVRMEDALARKDHAAAVEALDAWISSDPKSNALRRTAVRVHRESGRPDEMQKVLRDLRSLFPANPGVAGFAVVQNLLAAQDAAASAALDEYFFRFGADPGSLNHLATSIAQTGRDDILARLETHASSHGFPLLAIRHARVLAQISNRSWTAARQTLRDIEPDKTRMPKTGQVWFDTNVALVDACLDEGSGVQTRLVDLVSRHPGNLKLYRSIVEALRSAERIDTADMILALAEGMYPESDYLVSARREVLAAIERRDEAAASLAARTPRSEARRPSTLADLISTIDLLGKEGRPDEALRLISQLRRAQPELLLLDKTGEVVRRELDLCVRTRDLPLLQLTVRTFLKGSPDRGRTALELAKTWHGRGEKDAALLTLREIIKHRPDDEDALGTLVEWQPKPEVPAPDADVPESGL